MNLIQTAYALILFHTLVVATHGAAHVHLGINGTHWQMLFVVVVIWLGPLVAAVLLGRKVRTGFAILALSMIGAWTFGVAFHFLLPGADNVAELHHVAWAGTFSSSALMLAVVEAAGALVATAGYLKETTYIPARPSHRRSLPSSSSRAR